MNKNFRRKPFFLKWILLLVLASCFAVQKTEAQTSFGGEMVQVDDGFGNLSWVVVGNNPGQASSGYSQYGQAVYDYNGNFLGYSTQTYANNAGYLNAGTYNVGNGMNVIVNDGTVTITWPDGSYITSDDNGSYNADGTAGSCNGCSQEATAADYAVGAQQLQGINVSSQLSTANAAMNSAASDGDWLKYEYYWYYAYYIVNGSTLNGHGTTAPPPPPAPPPPDAITNGIPPCAGSTFISPEGMPITLAPGCTIGTLNLDGDIFTNGALYAFYDANGNEYIEREANDYTNSNSSTPSYMGYYPVIRDPLTGQRTWGAGPIQPGPNSLINYASPTNGIIAATSVLHDANCNVVQQPINYTVGGDVPSAIGTGSGLEQNDDIENAPTNGAPCGSSPLRPDQCPGSSGGTGNSPAADVDNLSNYLNGYGKNNLMVFLMHFTKNSIKVYFANCQTGNVSTTIDNAGVHNLSPADQTAATNTYNNSSFTSNDADIAIKASVCGGKWNYDIKFNPAKLNPDPHIAPVLGQVIAEIKAEADDEVKKLKVPGQTNPQESVNVGNGEQFSKAQMDLLEAISAIYDIGKDIINTGQLPTKMWDRGSRNSGTLPDKAQAHGLSPFKIPDLMGGAADQLIFEATGALQLVKTGLEVMRHPIQSATGIWNSLKTIDFSKIEQIASDMSGISNYQQGGDLAWYQGGKNGIQVAMLIFTSVKSLTEGATAIAQGGTAMENVEGFVQGTNSEAATVLKTAGQEGQAVDNLGNDLLTENVNASTGETDLEVLTHDGQKVEEKLVNNLDNIAEDVKQAASPEDLAAAASDESENAIMAQQPQSFKDGKAFEHIVDNDASHATQVASISGRDLTGYTPAGQVQIKLPDNTWAIADNVWYKANPATGKFDIVINETKLSGAAPFSNNQQKLMDELAKGNTSFTLRSTKFGQTFPGGSQLNVESMVKTVGTGVPSTSYTVYKIF
jgi:hypothetical protein